MDKYNLYKKYIHAKNGNLPLSEEDQAKLDYQKETEVQDILKENPIEALEIVPKKDTVEGFDFEKFKPLEESSRMSTEEKPSAVVNEMKKMEGKAKEDIASDKEEKKAAEHNYKDTEVKAQDFVPEEKKAEVEAPKSFDDEYKKTMLRYLDMMNKEPEKDGAADWMNAISDIMAMRSQATGQPVIKTTPMQTAAEKRDKDLERTGKTLEVLGKLKGDSSSELKNLELQSRIALNNAKTESEKKRITENYQDKKDKIIAANWQVLSIEGEDGVTKHVNYNKITGETKEIGNKGFKPVQNVNTNKYVGANQGLIDSEKARENAPVSYKTLDKAQKTLVDKATETLNKVTISSEEVVSAIDKQLDLMKSNKTKAMNNEEINKLVTNTLGTVLAKAFQPGGRLSDKDIPLYIEKKGLPGLVDKFNLAVTGVYTNMTLRDAEEILKSVKDAEEDKIKSIKESKIQELHNKGVPMDVARLVFFGKTQQAPKEDDEKNNKINNILKKAPNFIPKS